MPTILFRYVTKEVLFPALVALIALTFIIFMSVDVPSSNDQRLFWMLMSMMFAGDVPRSDILAIIALVLPSTLMFIAPMALLIGIIIGVGRMTLDLETRAIQTSGIPIYNVFLPIMGLGVVLTLVILFMSYAPEPLMLRASIGRVSKLLIAEFSNLEPGRVYEDLFSEDLGMNLYFEDRNPDNGRMQGVTLMLDRDAVKEEESRRKRKQERNREEDEVEDRYDAGELTAAERDRLLYEIKVRYKEKNPIMIFANEASFDAAPDSGLVELTLYDGTIHILDQRPQVEEDAVASSDPDAGEPQVSAAAALRGSIQVAQAGAESAPQAPAVATDAAPEGFAGLRSVLPTESAVAGTIPAVPAPDAPASAPQAPAEAADPANRDYMIVEFDKFTKLESIIAIETDRTYPAQTVPELWDRYHDEDEKDKYRLRAKASVLSRYSLALQSFVLAFLGLPLAVRVRPTGKSVGVLIAFALILVYHWLQRTGFAMVEAEQSLGAFVIFLPNLLFLAGGLVLWRQTLRS